jgi:hypothetical protein
MKIRLIAVNNFSSAEGFIERHQEALFRPLLDVKPGTGLGFHAGDVSLWGFGGDDLGACDVAV